METQIYVPRPDSHLGRTLKPGTAIVGSPDGSGSLRVHYEGGIYGQFDQLEPGERFVTFLAHAADRHFSNYPTVARANVNPDDMVAVGWFDSDLPGVEIDDEDTFNAWVEEIGARADTVGEAARHLARQQADMRLARRIQKGDPDAIIEWQLRVAVGRAS